tara:strand:- start:2514 stop:2702 length:189 start_codon:yes stop_codon:yes gene_type:complete
MLYLLLFLSYISINFGKLSIKSFKRYFPIWNKNETIKDNIFKKMIIIPYEIEPYEIDMFLTS